MSRDERLQEVLNAFIQALNDFAERRQPLDVQKATIQRLLAEIRELKSEGATDQPGLVA